MKPKTLLIEDNEQNLYLATYLLERSGHVVVPARSGPEGIELARRIQPDLILLDIQLPGMNGYEVAQELRRGVDLKEVPIVAVTSYAMVGDRQRSLAAGCNGYIEKPINPDTFLKEIEVYLKKPNGGPCAPRAARPLGALEAARGAHGPPAGDEGGQP